MENPERPQKIGPEQKEGLMNELAARMTEVENLQNVLLRLKLGTPERAEVEDKLARAQDLVMALRYQVDHEGEIHPN